MEKCRGVKIEEKEVKRRKRENRREKKKCKLTGKRESQRVLGNTSVYKVSEGGRTFVET